MKIKKVHVEFVNEAGLREETQISTVSVGWGHIENFSKTSIAKKYKIDLKRKFFMAVSCSGGHKYNFFNRGKPSDTN